jgi:hypothetical protein
VGERRRSFLTGVEMRTAAGTLGGTSVGGRILASLRSHSWIIALIIGYAAYGLLISTILGHIDTAWPLLYVHYFASKTLILLILYGIGRLLHAMLIVRPARLIDYVRNDFAANPEVHRQLLAGLPLALFVPVFLSVFTSQKSLIPELNPFGWDMAFADWDRAIHSGIDPWRIIQPIVVHPIVTAAIDFLYCTWFYLIQIICLWQAFSVKRPQLRMQFFFSFLLVWILLGNVAATFLSSAGPVYYEAVVGGGPYGPLMEYLHTIDSQSSLWAVAIQDQLWYSYLNPEVTVTRGISAMPSIHVSLAFLMTLLGWRVHRWLGLALTGYLVIIMIGSVHLGWHYAIDGYAGIIGTYLIWRGVGWALAKRSVADSAVAAA